MRSWASPTSILRWASPLSARLATTAHRPLLVSTAATRGTAICTQMSTPSPPHSSADSRDTAPALRAAAVMPWLALAAEIITPLARAAMTANVKPV